VSLFFLRLVVVPAQRKPPAVRPAHFEPRGSSVRPTSQGAESPDTDIEGPGIMVARGSCDDDEWKM
jgi:hypothetical protein